MRKIRIAGVVLAGVAALAIAGCANSNGTTGSPSTAPSSAAPKAAAKEAVITALTKNSKTSYKMSMSMNGIASMKSDGAFDPAGPNVSMNMEVGAAGSSLTTKTVSVGGTYYLKMTGIPGIPEQWMKIAADKITPGSSLDVAAQSSPSKTSESIVSAEWDGDLAIKGTIDGTKSPTVSDQMRKQLGDKAKSLPFKATLDKDGYVTSLTMDMSAVMSGLGEMKMTYSDFGKPVTITAPPASDVIDMPAALLDAMQKQ